jgi:tetratricopeptide (TPR) repeat protein
MSETRWSKRFQANRLCRAAARCHPDRDRVGKILDLALRVTTRDERTFLAKALLHLQAGTARGAGAGQNRHQTEPGRQSRCYLLEGRILFLQKQYSQARAAFEKTLELDRRNGLAKNFLAFCHLYENRIDEFRSLLTEEGLWHRPDLIRIAWTQQKLPVWKLHQEAREKHPGPELPPPPASASNRARVAFARKAMKRGGFAAAYQALLPVVEEAGAKSPFLDLFAEASVRSGNPEKARGFLEQAMAPKGKRKPETDPYRWFLLGQCRFLQGDYDAAVEAYRLGEPHTTMPYYSAMFEYYIALNWLAAGRLSEAGDAIEKACQIDPLLASLIAVSLTALLGRGEPLRELIDEE